MALATLAVAAVTMILAASSGFYLSSAAAAMEIHFAKPACR